MDVSNKNTYRTLSLTYGLTNVSLGVITVDIEKYFDAFEARIASLSCHALYTDITVGSPQEVAEVQVGIVDTTIMQLNGPGQVVGVPAVAAGINSPFYLSPNDHFILGDALLESPVFVLNVEAFKSSAGAYPAAFVFDVFIVLQFEIFFKNVIS